MSLLDQLDLFRLSPGAARAKAVTSFRTSPTTTSLRRSDERSNANRLLGVRVDTRFLYAERYELFENCRSLPLPQGVDTGPRASWVERVPGWITPDSLVFDALMADTTWQKQRREMYDRVVDVPRLLGRPTPGARSTTLMQALSRLLSLRYGRKLSSVSMALYRDGQDSVAPHGDKLGPLIPDTVVAIVSLGHPRTLRLRPKVASDASGNRPSSLRFNLGCGDLFVMGGRCQADWLHGIAKTRHAKARISVMFREEH